METENKDHKLRKFVYLALSSLLGVVLFVFIEQLLIQLALILLGVDSLPEMAVSLGALVALALGAWYGVWLGSSWYKKVYGGAEVTTEEAVTKVTVRPAKPARKEINTGGASWQMDDLLSMAAPTTEVQASPAQVEKKTRVAKPRARKIAAPKVQSATSKKPTVPVKKKTTTRKKKTDATA